MAALAPIALGIGLVGTAYSTYTSMQAAKAAAKGSEMEAQSVENKTEFMEAQQRRENKIMQGRANAVVAASGVDPGSGSPLFMELDRIKQGEMEALSIRQGGQMAAMSARYEGKLHRGRIPSIIGAGVGQGGSILTQYIARR